MSFLKFRESPTNDKDLHWQRADRDRAPFRGTKIPLLREEEFEELAEKVHNCKVGIFDTTDPENRQHGRTYQEVLDGVSVGWMRLLAERKYKWAKRGKKLTMLVYVEWTEPDMRLPQSIVKQMSTSVTPIEGEVNYGKSSQGTNGQPRPLRSGTKVSQR